MKKKKHTINKFKKEIRKMNNESLRKTYDTLKYEYGKLHNDPNRKAGGMGKDAGKMKVIRRDIARVLTEARERGIHIKSNWQMKKDNANLKLRV